MGEAVAYARSLGQLLEALRRGAPEASLKADLVRVRSHARSQALEVDLADDGTFLMDGSPTDSNRSELRPVIDAMRRHGIGSCSPSDGPTWPTNVCRAGIACARSPRSLADRACSADRFNW